MARPMMSIRPPRGAIIEHTNRVVYQARCIWGQAMICNMEGGNPGDWDWKKHSK